MDRIMECVPNFSEGRDLAVVEALADCFRARKGVKLLDYSADFDHNRSVITAAGEPEALREAMVAAIGVAVARIDLTKHMGQHPRIGAADVIPFVPLKGCDMEAAVRVARETARLAAEKFALPSFLYEQAATAPHRRNLADVRRGQFEGLAEKMRDPLWQPDFGPSHPHPTAGASAIGARRPLIAFNVNLDTDNLKIAKAIARRVRHSSGGLRCCKAIGIDLKERGTCQVSVNMTDYEMTSVYSIVEMVRMEARRYGARVIGTELIGLIPLQAVIDVAGYYLQLEDFTADRVLESRLWE